MTDGCAQQFKNVYALSSSAFAQEDFGITSEHHFLATSHGKGSHDGTGAKLKRGVRTQVLSKTVKVNTALEFYDVAKTIVKKTIVLYVPKTEVEEIKPMLENR